MNALLIGALHGLPVYWAARYFRSKEATNAVAVVMIVFGIITGNMAYFFLDLLGVIVGYIFALQHLAKMESSGIDPRVDFPGLHPGHGNSTAPPRSSGQSPGGGLLASVSYKARSSTRLWQVFQDNDYFAKVALANFEKCLNHHGVALSRDILSHAESCAQSFPQMSIGEYINVYVNR